MAYEEMVSFTRASAVAGVDMSAAQFAAIKISTNGYLAFPVAAKAIDGILQDNPTQYKAGTYARDGICKAAISASQSLSAGDLLEVDSGGVGTLKAHASGIIVAKVMEDVASVASVTIATVMLLRNAPTATAYS